MKLFLENGKKADVTISADEVAERIGCGPLHDNAGETVEMELLSEGTWNVLMVLIEEARDKEQELFVDARVVSDDGEEVFAMVYQDGSNTWWIANNEENLSIGWFDFLTD